VANKVFANNGSIDKYMGDGILAHFGVAYDTESYARQALLCAEQLKISLKEWSEQKKNQNINLDFGIAISLGEVIFGVVGHKDKMEITVIGDVVNLTAKIEKHTKNSKTHVLTTRRLFEAAVSQGYKSEKKYTELNKQNVEGLTTSIDLIGW
jgi:adenylate cyclase